MDDVRTLIGIIRRIAIGYAGEYGHGSEKDPDASVEWALGYDEESAEYDRIVAIAFPAEVKP